MQAWYSTLSHKSYMIPFLFIKLIPTDQNGQEEESKDKLFWEGNNRVGFFHPQDRREQLDHGFGSGFKLATEHRDQTFFGPNLEEAAAVKCNSRAFQFKRKFLGKIFIVDSHNYSCFAEFQTDVRWNPAPPYPLGVPCLYFGAQIEDSCAVPCWHTIWIPSPLDCRDFQCL